MTAQLADANEAVRTMKQVVDEFTSVGYTPKRSVHSD